MGIYSSILLRRPDFTELKKQGLTAVDMHYHSRFSDTYTRVSQIIAKAEKMGCGVSITDHNAIDGSKLAFKLKDDILVIPGIETSSREGPHILSYFDRLKDLEGYYEICVKENLSGDPYCRIDASVHDIIRSTKEFGGILSAAHPFAPGMMGLRKAISRSYIKKSVIKDFDAFEVLTGVNFRTMTKKSINWAKQVSAGITGGTDGHSLGELGNIVTYSRERTVKKFLWSIKEKQNRVMGKETMLAARFPSYTMTANKHLKFFRPFLASKARCLMNESVYYHTQIMNERLINLAAKSALLVDKKTRGIPGRVVRKGAAIVKRLNHGRKKKAVR